MYTASIVLVDCSVDCAWISPGRSHQSGRFKVPRVAITCVIYLLAFPYVCLMMTFERLRCCCWDWVTGMTIGIPLKVLVVSDVM